MLHASATRLLLVGSAARPRAGWPSCGGTADWRDAAFESMAARDWAPVDAALRAAVRGDAALPGDGGRPDDGLSAAAAAEASGGRVTWQLRVAYYGPAFSGYAWQPAAKLPTVQGCLQDAISPLLDGKSELRLECAGRTDAGVSSLGQLVSFHSPPSLRPRALVDAVARASPQPGALRLVHARRAPRGYHATFATAWRRYAYLLAPAAGQTAAAVVSEAAAIQAALAPLVGSPRDFASLGRSVPPCQSPISSLSTPTGTVPSSRSSRPGGTRWWRCVSGRRLFQGPYCPSSL